MGSDHIQASRRRTAVLAGLTTLLTGTGGALAARPEPGAVTPERLKVPSGPNSVRGLAGEPTVDPFTAQVGYQVPLELPSGFGGLAPAVALTYSGVLGNGPLGIGWSLAQTRIQRSTRRGVPRWDATDELEITGVASGRLVAISATEYRVEGMGQTMRVKRVGAGFEVDDGKGVKYRLGTAATGRQQSDDNHVLAWLCEDVTNVAGEHIRYEHLQDQGQVYPRKLIWGPGDVYQVDFAYEGRPDPTVSYREGFRVTTAKRLANVKVTAFGVERRAYQLAYAPPAQFPLSRLAGVTSTGRSGVGAWPGLSFTYASAVAPSATPDPIDAGAWRLNDNGTTLVDLDGDGASELLRLTSSGHSYRPNLDGVFGAANPLSGNTQSLDKLQLQDIDGDARPELLSESNNGWSVFKFKPTAWELQPGFWPGSQGVALKNDAQARFADLNGDGLVDAIQWNSSQLLIRWALRTGLATQAPQPPIGGSVLPADDGRFHDVNGDGLDDYVVVAANQLEKYLGHGDGTFEPLIGVPYPVSGVWSPANVELGDLDRDGLMDLVRVESGAVRWYRGRANGSFDSAAVQINSPEPFVAATVVVTVADSNGNGSQDVVWSSPTGMWRMDLAGATTAGMLTGVSNGIGMNVAFDYRSSHSLSAAARKTTPPSAWTVELPVSIPVPVQKRTALGPGEVTREVSYAVRNGFWDAVEQRFGGFLTTTVTTAGATPAETGVLITSYLSGSGSSINPRALRGKPLSEQVKDGTGRRLSLTDYTWSTVVAAGLPDVPLLRVPVLREKLVRFEDVSPVRRTRVTFDHDAMGRVRRETDEGRTDITGDESVKDTTYADDDTTWVRNLVCEEKVTSTAGVVASHTRTLFGDELTVHAPCVVGKGWPRRTQAWLGGSENRFVDQTRTAYNAHGSPVTIETGGTQTRIEYDDSGLFVAAERRVGGAGGTDLVWTADWDEVLGVATEITDPTGHVTHSRYDSLGRFAGAAIDGRPDHQVIEYDWIAPNPMPPGWNPRSTLWQFDGPVADLGAKPATWSAASRWRQTVEVSNGLGEVRYRAQRLAPAQWIISEYRERDPNSRVVFAGRPVYAAAAEQAGRPAGIVGDQLRYDALGRLIQQITPTGSQRTISYVAFERTTQESDLAPVLSVLDGKGRAIRTERSLADGTHEVVAASYDPAGRLTNMTLAGMADPRVFTYDTLGRLRTSRDPDLGVRTLTWDDHGRLTSEANAAGQTTTYTYDAHGRLSTRVGGSSYTYHYDVARPGAGSNATNLAGRLAWVEEPTGGLDVGYDEQGRSVFTRRRIDAEVSEATSVFSPSGLALSRGYDDGFAMSYVYDPAGRLTGITNLWQLVEQDASGLPTRERTQNGVETRYERDLIGLARKVTVRDVTGAAIYDVEAERNSWNAITVIHDHDLVGLDHNATFGYDRFSRLTSASIGSGNSALAFGYSYDVLHNMRTRTGPSSVAAFFGTYRYAEGGRAPRQLTSITNAAGQVTHTFTYDAAGRQTHQDDLTMTYDPIDRLLRVDGLPGGSVMHTYGQDGQRVKTVAPDGTVSYFFGDGSAERGGVREHDVAVDDRFIARVTTNPAAVAASASASPAAGTASSPAPRHAVAVLVLAVLAVGLVRRRRRLKVISIGLALTGACAWSDATDRVALATGSNTLFMHTGLSAGPTVFTDGSGRLVEERRYEPFGAAIDALHHTGGGDTVGPPDLKARDLNLLNKRTEAATGWSDHGARWMAPATGRWITTDPPVEGPDATFMSAPWALHPYQYVNQNPVAYWDPKGTCSAPVGLRAGQVGICIEAFIATPRVGTMGIGEGNDRGHSGTNPALEAKILQQVTFDPKTHAFAESTKIEVSAVSVGPRWLGLWATLRGTGGSQVDNIAVNDIRGERFTTFSAAGHGTNGFTDLPRAPGGSIDYRFNLRIDDTSGQVTVTNGLHKGFPSYGIYSYQLGSDGKVTTTTHYQFDETNLGDLQHPFNGLRDNPAILDTDFKGMGVFHGNED